MKKLNLNEITTVSGGCYCYCYSDGIGTGHGKGRIFAGKRWNYAACGIQCWNRGLVTNSCTDAPRTDIIG